jgi:hypothetical protein
MISRPGIVIIPWGTVIEDYLDPLGRSLADFRTKVSGGWVFNYVRALQLAGINPSVLVFSRDARRVERSVHGPTGVPFLTLPTTSAARMLRRGKSGRVGNGREGGSPREAATGWSARDTVREAFRYLSTPPLLLARTLREVGAGAVLCQEYEWERFDLLVRLGRRIDLPVFGVFQGGSTNTGFLSRAVRRASVRMSAGLVIGSRREAERVQATYGIPLSAIGPFPNPIGLDEVGILNPGAARAELDIPADAFVVAWHGRVDLYTKGVDLLAEAWHRFIAAEGPSSAVLLLIGSGPHDAQLRALLGPRLHDGTVRWIDQYTTDRHRIYHYLSAANVYAFPSRKEGFPVAPLEAMAAGLPLIAAQAHGVDEIVPRGEEDGGLRIPAEDAGALASAFAELARDPERVGRLGAAARRRVAEGFALEPIGRAMRDWLMVRGLRTAGR